VKSVKLKRPKEMECSPSYVDYRPKVNAAILLDTGYTKGRPYTEGQGKGRKSKT
jgi:hypothetical protein